MAGETGNRVGIECTRRLIEEPGIDTTMGSGYEGQEIDDESSPSRRGSTTDVRGGPPSLRSGLRCNET